MKEKLVIFDFNRTIYDPENGKLIKGVKWVLSRLLKAKVKMILVSKNEKDRAALFSKFGLEKYFEELFFVEDKSEEVFRKIAKKYHSSNIYVVGDYLHEEIYYGNLIGAETIWFRSGKFSDLKMRNKQDKPNYIIKELKALIPVIE
jgi:FMN phosphatase YigB (HAD superfamily)